jgi:hypothetical protein
VFDTVSVDDFDRGHGMSGTYKNWVASGEA